MSGMGCRLLQQWVQGHMSARRPDQGTSRELAVSAARQGGMRAGLG